MTNNEKIVELIGIFEKAKNFKRRKRNYRNKCKWENFISEVNVSSTNFIIGKWII